MLDAEDILNGLLRGAISGRRKPWRRTRHALGGGSLVNARTMLAAAGVAWGLYETWQAQQPSAAQPATPPGRPASAAPPPIPGTAPAAPPAGASTLPAPLLQLMRLMASAARADGGIGPEERARILAEAREVGAEAEMAEELAVTRPLAEIVRGAEDPDLRRQLYSLAFTIVRADEALTGGERIYLAQLAHLLSLDPATVQQIEAEVETRIDASRPTAADETKE